VTSKFISVLMPVHNGACFIGEALDSLSRQTAGHFEVIIIDDGSTDGSEDIIGAYACRDERIRCFRRRHRGLVVSLNDAIALARGEYLARMDSDDVAHPDRFRRQAVFLAENPACVAVGSQVECIDQEGSLIGLHKYETAHDAIMDRLLFREFGPTMAHPAVMMRRDVVVAVGGYRAKFVASEDRDLWLRLAERGRLANLPDVLLRYRLHLSSFSHNRGAEQRRMALVAVHDAYERRQMTLPDQLAVPVWHRESEFEYRSDWVSWAIRDGNLETARKHLIGVVSLRPFGVRCWGRLAWRYIASAATAFGKRRTNTDVEGETTWARHS
jgi:glycosyltransferase involved in cell wall biosynthesis